MKFKKALFITAGVTLFSLSALVTASNLLIPDLEATTSSTDHSISENIREKYAEQISKLSALQKYVTLNAGTERPFANAYWDNKEPGIYVDVISGEPLFSSLDKYDSGSGWPSFTKPIDKEMVTEHADNSFGMSRVEIKSKNTTAHLGHVFNDGPKERGGLRYCTNSASLRFVHKDDLVEQGYEEYLVLFKNQSFPTAKLDKISP